MPQGKFDEQHISGHSWTIRGLVEYYYMTKDKSVKEIVERMVKNYLLPAKGCFSKYPIDRVNRFNQQDVWILSKLQTKTKHHAETSDAGCVFIMLDGATKAYELLRWPELKELIEEMISRYMEMDLIALNIQTHATLSGIRGILRFYELEKDEKYLEMAVKIFDLYKVEAWTECYGNYNWFGAPRWTEPCAIIDSFIVAVMLWKHTKRAIYLEDAHLIYYNALSHGNRVNGSFGTDKCTGAVDADDNLFIAPINYETYWCCTMRGGEGFSRAIEYNFFIDEENVYIPFYNNCTAVLRFENSIIKLEEKTEYPYYGTASFEILESTLEQAVQLNFLIPSWTGERVEIYINGDRTEYTLSNKFARIKKHLKQGDIIRFDLGLSLRVEKAELKNSIKGYHKFLYGPMLLGSQVETEINSLDGNRFENYAESRYKSASEIKLAADTQFERISRSEFKVKGSDTVFSCLCAVKDMTREDSMKQILFKE